MEAMWARFLLAITYFKTTFLPKIGCVRGIYAEFSFSIYSPTIPLTSSFLSKNASASALLG
jgi:dihydrodiol dehydrogenase / D-xylose 1-dehydrogenase (NADP)